MITENRAELIAGSPNSVVPTYTRTYIRKKICRYTLT